MAQIFLNLKKKKKWNLNFPSWILKLPGSEKKVKELLGLSS